VTKTLAELKNLCDQLGIIVPPERRPAKEPYLLGLRDHIWAWEHPGQPLPEQIEPMLLGDWNDLTDEDAVAIEKDESGWCVQEKKDGVRALLHVTPVGVRITGRTISDMTFRLTEFQDNLPHLTGGFDDLVSTVLDGELLSPVTEVNTGDTTTASALQATVAILAAGPVKATAIQDRHDAHLRFHAFDVVRYRGEAIVHRPLADRLATLEVAYLSCTNPYVDLVPTNSAGKVVIHERLVAEGKEGTVWKNFDQPYQPGRRVRHWIKRKRGLEVEAVVTGFKPGTADRGNANLVGAVEFSIPEANDLPRPIAWVSSWTDEERQRMTSLEDGAVILAADYVGRRAVITGQDIAGKSGRIRHARIVRWLDENSDGLQLPGYPGGGRCSIVSLREPDQDGVAILAR
jgi:ATP-dependent DNA ligase